ncbi:MAG: zinc ribbon domain-containing protein [Lachnospiraceae bacterium]|nr:zinc ribbon domain-containing protein [Lachnospiraceae bacterium]
MAFCRKCGSSLLDKAKFCNKCGSPVALPGGSNKQNNVAGEVVALDGSSVRAISDVPVISVEKPRSYEGRERTFVIEGTTIKFSPSMDEHIYYKKRFLGLARDLCDQFSYEYSIKVNNLDSFLLEVPRLFSKYRNPIIDVIVAVLIESEIYSVSRPQVEEMLSEITYRIDGIYTPVVNEFNSTLELNQQKKARNWSMLPNMFFSGISGIIIGTALNFAVNEMAESSIKNANVTQFQRGQIFKKINPNEVSRAVYYDFITHYKVLIRMLHERGNGIWIPDSDSSESAGLFTNLRSGLIPQDKTLMAELKLIQFNPLNLDYINLLSQDHSEIQGVKELIEYLK